MQGKRLTARAVETLARPGRHADGQGLYLTVDESGARRWVFIWRRGKLYREIGLGSPARGVSLKLAREFAEQARGDLARGLDPKTERDRRKAKAAGVPTFAAAAEEFIRDNAGAWKSEKHVKIWSASLRNHAGSIMELPVDQVTTDHVLSVLKPLWLSKADIGRRVQNRIERILDAATVRGLRAGDNPGRWRNHLALLLPKKRTGGSHFAAMPYNDVPAFVEALRARPAPAALALELAILTAGRTAEVLGARFAEFDIENAIWTLSKERMKAGREHRVPLSARAVEIIRMLQASAGAGEFLFPGAKPGRTLSAMAMAMLLRRMGAGEVTVHGFRSSFRDWAGNDTEFPRELAEAALAHVIGDRAEQAYRRSDALERRRALMQAWADFVGGGQ